MTPVTQTKVVVKNSKGETIVNGNCYAAAIATMLDVPITEVPNIEVFFGTTFDYKWLMNAWLREKYNMKVEWAEEFEIFHEGFEEGDRYDDDANAKRLKLSEYIYLAIGTSGRGVSHVCIYQGGEMIHDPHPTGEGLIKVENFQKIVPLEEGESKMAPKSSELIPDPKKCSCIDPNWDSQCLYPECQMPSPPPIQQEAIPEAGEVYVAWLREFRKSLKARSDAAYRESQSGVSFGRNLVGFADGLTWAMSQVDWLLEKEPPSPPFVKADLPDTHVGDMPEQAESQPSIKTEREESPDRITTLQGVVDWIDQDAAEHAKEFPGIPTVFVKGAMNALQNLKHFIDVPPQPSPTVQQKEVPKEISEWIEAQDRDYPGSGHAIGWKKGAIVMYHKMEAHKNDLLKMCRSEFQSYKDTKEASLQSQLADAEVVNKSYDRVIKKIILEADAIKKERDDYRKALEEIKSKANQYYLANLSSGSMVHLWNIANEIIFKYPIHQTPNK